MLYSDLVTQLELYEYKLILESMLIEMGWYYDIKTNAEHQAIAETCREYVLCNRSSANYDAVLARSAHEALMNANISEIEETSGLTQKSHSITILKKFLLNSQSVKDVNDERPTEKKINELFADFNAWVGKLYNKDTLKSISASNPKIRLCLVRTFVTNKTHNNYTLAKENPHLLDYLYDDFLQDCRDHPGMMENSEGRPGHEGRNDLQLIGTLVFGMNNFITKWAKEKLPRYTHRTTTHGSGEESYDQLDLKYSEELDAPEINLSKILSDIANVNNCIFKDKTSGSPYYSILSWYQTLFLKETTLDLRRMLEKFSAGSYDQIVKQAGRTAEKSMESILDELPFNMSLTATIKGGTKITGNNNVIYAPSYGTARFTTAPETTAHFIAKFKEILLAIWHTYSNKDSITLSNLFLETRIVTETDKSNYFFDEAKVPDAEYRRILTDIKTRYDLKDVPTNMATHDIATLIYGLNSVVDLAEFLEQDGLSIMDAPMEQEMIQGMSKFISNTESLLVVRGLSNWKFTEQYNFSQDSTMRNINLLTDTELTNLSRSPLLPSELTESVTLPTGQQSVIVDTNNSCNDDDIIQNVEDEAQRIIKHQRSTIQARVEEPIYTANTTGRDKFIADHRVDCRVRVINDRQDSTFNTKVRRVQTQMSMLFSSLLPEFEAPLEELTGSEKLLFSGYNAAMTASRQGGTAEAAEQAKKGRIYAARIIESVFERCSGRLHILASLPMFNRKSLFCNEYIGSAAEFAASRIMTEITDIAHAQYLIGVLAWIEYSSEMPANSELAQLMENVDKQQFNAVFMACDAKADKLAIDLKKADFSSITVDSLTDGTLKGLISGRDAGIQGLNQITEGSVGYFAKMINSSLQTCRALQTALTTVGKQILNAAESPILLSKKLIIDYTTGKAYASSARKLSTLDTGYKLLGTLSPNGTMLYENIAADKICTSESKRLYTLKTDPSQVYRVEADQSIIDGKRWLDISKMEDKVIMRKENPDDKRPIRYIKLNLPGDSQINKTFVFNEGSEEPTGLLALGRYLKSLGIEIPKMVVDLEGMLSEYLNNNACKMIQQTLAMSPKIRTLTPAALVDLPSALSTLVLVCNSMGYINKLTDKYDNLMKTFEEYNVICALKRDGKITAPQFIKNNIILASYSDLIQMMIIGSERDVQEIQEYVQQAKNLLENVRAKRYDTLSGIQRSLELDYILPIDDDYQAYTRAYPVLVTYIRGVFNVDVQNNLQRIQEAITAMRRTMLELLRLRPISLTQIKYNITKFQNCRIIYNKTVENAEYKHKLMQFNSEDRILRRFRARFKIDPETGVFFDPDKQQYFFNTTSDIANRDNLDTLVNRDGMLMRYVVGADGNESFTCVRLSKVRPEVIDIILHK